MNTPDTDPIDALTVQFEEDGVEKVRELEKHVLSRGSWATIAFLFQEYDVRAGAFKPAKVSLRRYRRRKDRYVFQSKFTLSSLKQAKDAATVLTAWADNHADDA